MENKNRKSLWQADIIRNAALGSFLKLDPRALTKNPVMLIVEAGSVIVTLAALKNIFHGQSFDFNLQICLWLWFTVLFANFAEALAEGRGKAQAETLRKTRGETFALKLLKDGSTESVPAPDLRKGDVVLAKDNDMIPCDGEVIEGVSLVDESAITGESAPVVRESGGDKSGVTGGTRVLSGSIKIKVTADPGETFLDQMIKMVESAKRHKTPNEIALEVLLIAMTVLFFVVVVTLKYFAAYMAVGISVPILISLLVCLMPTTIGGLLPAIGIAGMDRLLSNNVIALSGRAVEAAGDVNVVLLDKTGTITLGNRMATEFIPASGVTEEELADTAMLSSLADETPEGRSIVVLAKDRLKVRGSDIRVPDGSSFIKFSAETRMSGLDTEKRCIRKGSFEAIQSFVRSRGGQVPDDVESAVSDVSGDGGTPLVVADGSRALGVIRLKDIVKNGIKTRLAQLANMGIESIMITGDNPLTAVVIAAEAGVSDFIAPAKPETKLNSIRELQSRGNMVAMIGDGTNDAPALAQADVAVAMNAGTQAAREAANMIDLDSSPTKLLDIVEIGKQILITRGSITTFSVTNDVAKYFAIIPAIFAATYPMLGMLNIMRLHSPQSAVLSAIIFNAVIIPFLIPLSLRGVKYKQSTAQALLMRNFLIYGVGGLILPFIGIKFIDLLIVWMKLV
jgi:potassium-transporting ATPase ATP-binding subunit